MTTAADRLRLLLPLANDDTLPVTDVRERLLGFLHDFETPGLRVSRDAGMWDAYRDAPASELKAVQRKLQLVFTTGFMFDGPPGLGTENITPDDIEPPLTFPSVRFAAFAPTLTKGRERRGFSLMVDARRLRDLVPYLVMHMLTTGDVRVGRCTAPAYRQWDERCNKFILWKGQGRPPHVCDDAKCVARVKAKAKHERDALRRKEETRLNRQRQKRGRNK